MKTDRELLELAAKAAGIKIHEGDDGTVQRRPIWCVTHYVQGQPYCDVPWNPLTDDGDALRLAVKLKLTVSNQFHECEVFAEGGAFLISLPIFGKSAYAPNEKPMDENAVTRRAIVGAAALICEESE